MFRQGIKTVINGVVYILQNEISSDEYVKVLEHFLNTNNNHLLNMSIDCYHKYGAGVLSVRPTNTMKNMKEIMYNDSYYITKRSFISETLESQQQQDIIQWFDKYNGNYQILLYIKIPTWENISSYTYKHNIVGTNLFNRRLCTSIITTLGKVNYKLQREIPTLNFCTDLITFVHTISKYLMTKSFTFFTYFGPGIIFIEPKDTTKTFKEIMTEYIDYIPKTHLTYGEKNINIMDRLEMNLNNYNPQNQFIILISLPHWENTNRVFIFTSIING
jgi:hypothetical protein